MTDRLSGWIIAILAGVIGFAGLFAAARATDGTMLWVGLVVFAWAVGFEFWLMKRGFDAAERGE